MSEEKNGPAIEQVTKPESRKDLPDLKAHREALGLTIQDIYLKTRINVATLTAIENGDFHLLPAPLYAKKFIEIYAGTIGVDAGSLLAGYQRYLDAQQPAPEEVKPVKTPQPASDRRPSKRYLWIAAVAIIAAGIVFAIFQKPAPPRPAQPRPTVEEQKSAPVAPAPPPAVQEQPPAPAVTVPQAPPPAVVPKETPPPAAVPKATPPPALSPKETTQPKTGAPLALIIEATETTWLQVTADRKPPFQTTLKKGEKLSREAREFFVVDVGNAAGVNITFQGKPLGSLGEKGQVVHLRLPQQ